jgi:hypothetical protein
MFQLVLILLCLFPCILFSICCLLCKSDGLWFHVIELSCWMPLLHRSRNSGLYTRSSVFACSVYSLLNVFYTSAHVALVMTYTDAWATCSADAEYCSAF